MNVLGLGLPELIVIALILLLFFGPKRLPSLFRSLGSSVKELKDGLAGEPQRMSDEADVVKSGKTSVSNTSNDDKTKS